MNNAYEYGDIGIGNNGQFQGNGPGTVVGNIEFAAADTGQYSNNGLTVDPSPYDPLTPNPHYNDSMVTSALNTMNSLSQTLGLETGSNIAFTNGLSINATSDTVDSSGNYVFTVTNLANFNANTSLTINATGNEYVVFNIPGTVGNNGLDGAINLTGGIGTDHVIFNWTPSTSNLTTYNNDYSSLSGGPTMTISTNFSGNGNDTHGLFLDPTGPIQIDNSYIKGRVVGGDTHNESYVSGAMLQSPEPSGLALASLGILCLAAWRRATRRSRQSRLIRPMHEVARAPTPPRPGPTTCCCTTATSWTSSPRPCASRKCSTSTRSRR